MNQDQKPQIVMEQAQSYKYDLAAEVLTVHFDSKPDTTIRFHLFEEERNKIADRYYNLAIEELKETDPETGTIWIEDECMIMPKLYTILHVKTKATSQHIQIDEGCNDFYFSNFRKAARVKAFLALINEILGAKP